MDYKRTKLEVPQDYVKRLILVPLLSGVILINLVIIMAFVITDSELLGPSTGAILYTLAGMEILIILAYLYFAIIMSHRIAGPIKGLKRTLSQIRDGDLTNSLRFRKKDFHSDLPEEFNATLSSIRDHFDDVKGLVSTLETASENGKPVDELVAKLSQKLSEIKTRDEETTPPPTSSTPSSKQAGFTLLELMFVVAIISILTIIALPAYLEYAVRTKVTEALNVAASAKATVTENLNNGAPPCYGASTGPIGHVASYTCNPANGVLQMVMDDTAKNTVVTLTPTTVAGGFEWECTGMPNKYLPGECRI